MLWVHMRSCFRLQASVATDPDAIVEKLLKAKKANARFNKLIRPRTVCMMFLCAQFVSSICLLNWSRCLNKHVYMATGYIIITGHRATRPAAAPPRSRRSGGSRIVWGPSPEPRGVDRVAPQGEIPLPADVWGPRARAPGPARGPRAPVPRAMALGPWPLPPWKIPLPADVWGPRAMVPTTTLKRDSASGGAVPVPGRCSRTRAWPLQRSGPRGPGPGLGPGAQKLAQNSKI